MQQAEFYSFKETGIRGKKDSPYNAGQHIMSFWVYGGIGERRHPQNPNPPLAAQATLTAPGGGAVAVEGGGGGEMVSGRRSTNPTQPSPPSSPPPFLSRPIQITFLHLCRRRD